MFSPIQTDSLALVVALREERDALYRQIAKDYGRLKDAPLSLLRQYNVVSARHNRALTSLSESWLSQDPTRQRRQDLGPLPGPTATSTGSDEEHTHTEEVVSNLADTVHMLNMNVRCLLPNWLLLVINQQ